MKSIGFVGLGTMGAPMAANLLKKGYSVTVYNRNIGKANELSELGADVANTPRELAKSVDVIITMISNDKAITEVYYGENGILNGLTPSKVMIDCSTISPDLSRKLGSDARERYCDFIDSPVTGSKPAAIEGSLLFMAGGDSIVVEQHRDLLLAMGRDVIYLGPQGSGSVAKLAHNTIVGINAVGLIEGMSIAAKNGMDASAFLRIINGGGAASKQAELKGQKIIDRDFSVQFSLELMLKDLGLSTALTHQLGIPTPMLDAAKNMFQIGQAAGYGDSDLSALANIYESWIGKRIGETNIAPAYPMQQQSDSERRKKTRLPLNIPIMMSIYQWEQEGSFAGQSVTGYLMDLSEDGIQLETQMPLAQDMFVIIHFLQESELPPMTARIIRVEKNKDMFKYGCMLSALPLYQHLQLKEYIERKSSHE